MCCLLRVEELFVAYGDIQVLRNVSIRVEKGTLISVVGANCAGKSTLLNAISGLIKPVSGRIVFQGEDLIPVPSHEIIRRGIVQVPEGRQLFPLMNVKENLLLGAGHPEARKVSAATLKQVLQLFPILESRFGQGVATLSGGEQQMVAIGRAIMAKPKLLILDEPSLGLAPLMVKDVFKVVERLHEEEAITTLLVEQNIKHALSLSHYAYVLENGRIVLEGPSGEIMNNEHTKKAYLGM
jgi:branched-chain amino acid transport system ATP-binding protein